MALSLVLQKGAINMPVKIVISSLGLVLGASSITPFIGHGNFAIAQITAAETTLALCETPSQTVRIYQVDGDTLMRAYDRQDQIIWINRTPVSTETTPEGIRYTNLFGEQTVTTVVNTDSNNCTVQLATNTPEVGTLSRAGSARPDQPLDQARQLFPAAVAQLEAQCQHPSTLAVDSFQNTGQPPRAKFTCWGTPDTDGERTGQWLGNLPLTEEDPTFIQSFTCSAGDAICATQLEAMETLYPDTLEAAEFACSMKNGRLFFATAGEALDLRCGYMATTLWDTDGDGISDYSDPVSVDESVGQVLL